VTDESLYALLAPTFAAARDRPFLTAPDDASRSYAEIDGLARRMAGAIAAAGAKPGDRIAAQVEKSGENVALYLASLLGGFVYLPLNTAYTDEELAYFIADAEPAVFVTDPARAGAAPTGPRVLTLDAAGRGSLTGSAAGAQPHAPVARGREDLAVILYTSGTTGRPKGAMVTHGNLTSNAEALRSIWGFGARDVLLHALPIFHIHGLFVALNTAMLSEAEVLFLPKFDAGEVRRHLPRASVMMGVPTFYTRLLSDPDFGADDCRAVRLFISGSAPLTPETFRAFEARTSHRILERYGMSEAGMIASNPLEGERIAGTVGYPLPGVELRIGDGGVVEVKGPNVFKGYWRNPQKTADEFRADGWFSTGDIGHLSADGRLTLSGRAKDLIIVGGYNVYPKEIEEVLDALPEIAESAVIGVPHPDMGEGVVAVLVPAKGSAAAPPMSDEELKKAVSVLARFKQPRTFVWMDALPRNTMGKVQKAVIRERLKASSEEE
jgi:malonyl-CoA/methylmalonyl-CoA synthetase